MRVGSLFAGIGGFDLAAEWMGWETVWFSEIDPYAAQVLAERFPGVPNHGDITRIIGRDVEPVDLLCGGFPCQDISPAGKGAGIEGARSGLWAHYARLIGEIRPRWVVIENSSLLRSRGLDKVLRDLLAFGYDAEWHCIPASYVGAPHRRDRIWIVAYPQRIEGRERRQPALLGRWSGEAEQVGLGGCELPLADPDSLARHEGRAGNATERPRGRYADRGRVSAHDMADATGERPAEARQLRHEQSEERTTGGSPSGGVGLADSNGSRLEGHAGNGSLVRRPRSDGPTGPSGLCGRGYSEGWWAVEPDVGRVASRVPARVDRLRCLGNAIVPQVAFFIFQAIAEAERLATSVDRAADTWTSFSPG